MKVLSFRYKFIDLPSEQQNLAKRTIEVLNRIPRPLNVRSEFCHGPELENWNQLQPAQMVADPDSAYDSAIFMLTPEGFAFFLPILLAWIYYEAPGDYNYLIMDLIGKNYGATIEITYRPYFSTCFSLMDKNEQLDEILDSLRQCDEEEWSFEENRSILSRQKTMLMNYEKAFSYFKERAVQK